MEVLLRGFDAFSVLWLWGFFDDLDIALESEDFEV
jgi:hypothetical protein